MADFMTPDEIEQFKQLVEQQYRDGFITAKQYNQAMKDAAVGVRGYTAAMESSLKQLGTSFKALGKDIYEGKKGVGVFSGTLDTGATAVAAYATKFGPAGVALGAFTKAVTAFVTASLKQSDLLFDSYEKISRAGAVGAGAMTEVFDSMLKFGYTVDQLGNLGELLARNSRGFGMFFKSALDGTRAFSEVADSIQNSPLRQQFFRLGMGVEEINDGIAGFVNQQGKLGRVQGMTVDQLAAGAQAYIKELDILTKLTGMTRKEQEDAREQALQIRQFYAGLADLDDKAAEQALQAFTMALAKGGPEAAADMAADFNGVITGAGKMFMATGGRSMEVFSKEFFARGGTAAESFERLQQYISPEFVEMTKNMNKLNSDMGSFDARILTMLKGGPGAERLSKILDKLTDEQYKQLTGMDKATAGQARARDSQIKSAQNLQEFVKLGVAPATQALAYFTEAIEYLTDFIPGAGSAKKRRAEEQAIREGKITTTQRMESDGRTAGSAVSAGTAQLTPAENAINTDLLSKLSQTGITGKREQANILAQIQAESGGVARSENLNYSPEQLLKTFPKHVKSMEDAQQLVAQGPEAVGNRVYGGRMGNQANEGFMYRGRGLIQLTGKDNYAKYGRLLGLDLINNPDLANDPKVAQDIAVAYFNEAKKRGTNLSDIGDIGKAVGYVDPGGKETEQRSQLSKQIERLLPQARSGGILAGPSSGYTATLHGTEAVVPLPNGKTIPVEMAGFSNNFADQTSLMSQQLDKLDELVRVMQSQVSISTKILQVTN